MGAQTKAAAARGDQRLDSPVQRLLFGQFQIFDADRFLARAEDETDAVVVVDDVVGGECELVGLEVVADAKLLAQSDLVPVVLVNRTDQ
jgi:hypothetical protein